MSFALKKVKEASLRRRLICAAAFTPHAKLIISARVTKLAPHLYDNASHSPLPTYMITAATCGWRVSEAASDDITPARHGTISLVASE